MIVSIIVSCILLASGNDLECMSVHVEWVFSGIVIVQDQVDNVALVEDEGVGIRPVDADVARGIASGHDRV